MDRDAINAALGHKLLLTDATKEHCQLYSIFRDYVKHEDDLTNQRLNWNFTIQGFLFAAYTFTLQKISEVSVEILEHLSASAKTAEVQAVLGGQTLGLRELRFAALIVALVGLFVSVGVYLSVSAARTAIGALEERWHTLHPAPHARPIAARSYRRGLT